LDAIIYTQGRYKHIAQVNEALLEAKRSQI
jgi:hypothetical protein